jgi:hypothetical protein
VALHRFIAGDYILEDAGEDMVDAGAAIGRRRAFIEGETGAVAAGFHTAPEGVLLAP